MANYLRMEMNSCYVCQQPLTLVYIDTGIHKYHQHCFQCFECKSVLTNTYVAVGDKVYCESHAYNANPVFCGECGNVIKGKERKFKLTEEIFN
jgi:hypothetical protein